MKWQKGRAVLLLLKQRLHVLIGCHVTFESKNGVPCLKRTRSEKLRNVIRHVAAIRIRAVCQLPMPIAPDALHKKQVHVMQSGERLKHILETTKLKIRAAIVFDLVVVASPLRRVARRHSGERFQLDCFCPANDLDHCFRIEQTIGN